MIGQVIKLLSGTYTVHAENSDYLCTARGTFRKKRIAPFPGDFVRIVSFPDHTGRIDEILPRKNHLIRPSVANIDLICYVCSYTKPTPFPFTIDKILVISQLQGIVPVLIFNKSDLAVSNETDALADLYEKIGYNVFRVSAAQGTGLDHVKGVFKNKTIVFAGNTGVGKSSILNAIYPDLTLKTGEISEKLGRGKHTTRHIEFFRTEDGLIADTPGFGALDLEEYALKSELLQSFFPEFAAYKEHCLFPDCKHFQEGENECAVRAAVRAGKINGSRYNSYQQIYQYLKEKERSWKK